MYNPQICLNVELNIIQYRLDRKTWMGKLHVTLTVSGIKE